MQKPKEEIAVIGGGPSGSMIVLGLIDGGYQGTIHWINDREAFGPADAFGVKDPTLGMGDASPLKRVSLRNDDSEDLIKWLRENEEWRKIHPSYQDIEVNENARIPRLLYGKYTESRLNEAIEKANADPDSPTKVVKVVGKAISTTQEGNYAPKEVIKFAEGARIVEGGNHDGETIDTLSVNKAVLATGRSLKKLEKLENLYTENGAPMKNFILSTGGFCWEGTEDCTTQEDVLKAGKGHLVIVGSGLSFAGLVREMEEKGFKGKYTNISLSGLRPRQTWPEKKDYDLQVFKEGNLPRTAGEFIKMFRQEARLASKSGFKWQDVVDALALPGKSDVGMFNKIWGGFSASEKEKINEAGLPSVWDALRNRMLHETGEVFKRLNGEHRIKMVGGLGVESVIPIDDGNKGFDIRYHDKKTGREEVMHADFLVNTTGLTNNITRSGNPLIADLQTQGRIGPSKFNLGIKVAPDSLAVVDPKGKKSSTLFVGDAHVKGEDFYEANLLAPMRSIIANRLLPHLLGKERKQELS